MSTYFQHLIKGDEKEPTFTRYKKKKFTDPDKLRLVLHKRHQRIKP